MRRLSAFILFILVAPTLAQERTHDITPDDYASVNTITEIAVSPDGKQVAYCLATWDRKADNRKTDLWVVSTDGKGTPRQLTKDRANDRKPKWSSDGKAVCWCLDVGMSAPLPVSKTTGGRLSGRARGGSGGRGLLTPAGRRGSPSSRGGRAHGRRARRPRRRDRPSPRRRGSGSPSRRCRRA